MTSISRTSEVDELGRLQKLIIEVSSDDRISWQVGDCTLTLETDWRQDNPEDQTVGGFTMLDWTTLVSEFPDPRPVDDHLEVQDTLRRFLACAVFQRGMYYRRHQVSDESFPERINGTEIHFPYRELLIRHTNDQFIRQRPTHKQLQDQLVTVEDVGAHGLARWAAEQRKWEPFVARLMQLFMRFPTVPEDFVVSCAIALEHAGNILGRVPGERATYSTSGKKPAPATATWMLRCIHQLQLDWSKIATGEVSIARAISRQYNGTKHYRKNRVADDEALFLTAQICRVVVRLFSLWIADPSGASSQRFGQYQVEALENHFNNLGVSLDAEGFFVPIGNPSPDVIQ